MSISIRNINFDYSEIMFNELKVIIRNSDNYVNVSTFCNISDDEISSWFNRFEIFELIKQFKILLFQYEPYEVVTVEDVAGYYFHLILVPYILATYSPHDAIRVGIIINKYFEYRNSRYSPISNSTSITDNDYEMTSNNSMRNDYEITSIGSMCNYYDPNITNDN